MHAVVRHNRNRKRLCTLDPFPQGYHLPKLHHSLPARILTPIQARYRTFPSPQGSLTLPFYGHAHFSPAPTSSLILTTANLFSISIISSFRGNLQYKSSGTGFSSLRIMLYRFLQVAAHVEVCRSFRLLNGVPWYGCACAAACLLTC